jgi:hypothetical protein
MARVINQVEPPRPSEVVSTTEPDSGSHRPKITPEEVSAVREGDPARLRKRLAGDLDSILLMSLRKEPERRYGSVEAFAGDLDKHLAHRPVAAREPTIWYRLRSFSRRNVGALVACLLVMTSLLAGVVAVIWQTRREMAPTRATAVDAGPFVVFAIGVVLVGLGFAVYLARPSRNKFLGALAGGAIWAGSAFSTAWLAHALGWWRSQVAGIPEPLVVFTQPIWRSGYAWFAHGVGMTALLFLLFWIQKRFGWKWLAIILCVWSAGKVIHDRYWFSTVMPAIEYTAGWESMLVEIALTASGGLAGLLIMRVMADYDQRRSGRPANP